MSILQKHCGKCGDCLDFYVLFISGFSFFSSHKCYCHILWSVMLNNKNSCANKAELFSNIIFHFGQLSLCLFFMTSYYWQIIIGCWSATSTLCLRINYWSTVFCMWGFLFFFCFKSFLSTGDPGQCSLRKQTNFKPITPMNTQSESHREKTWFHYHEELQIRNSRGRSHCLNTVSPSSEYLTI